MEMIGGMGMEGFIFYWLFWTFWVIVTFFMNKKSERLRLSMWLLLTIVFSNYSVTIFNINFSLSSLFILLTSYFLIGKQNRLRGIYLLITSFIVMLAYVTFHLFELYDPVWLIFNRQFMLAVILVYLALLLHSDLKQRLLTILSGVVHGEILCALILRRFTDMYTIGTFAFLDCIAITVAILLAVSGLRKVSVYFENHIKHLEREKQKQS